MYHAFLNSADSDQIGVLFTDGVASSFTEYFPTDQIIQGTKADFVATITARVAALNNTQAQKDTFIQNVQNLIGKQIA